MEDNKSKALKVTNFLNNENPKGRLQSLRLPRDLSLGGTKIKKKTYTPNLKAVRNKDKAKDILLKETKSQKKTTPLNNHINKRPKYDGKKFVQIEGVFSQGTEVSRLPSPKVEAKKPQPEPVKSERVQSNLTNTFDVTSTSNEEKLEVSEDEKNPTTFTPFEWSKDYFKCDTDNITLRQKYMNTDSKHFKEIFKKINSSKDKHFMLWNLPDMLPLDRRFRKSDENHLYDLREGRIGKILRRKSGKIDVFLGNCQCNIVTNAVDSCMQYLVLLNSQNQTASVLGDVGTTFSVTPRWESLLNSH